MEMGLSELTRVADWLWIYSASPKMLSGQTLELFRENWINKACVIETEVLPVIST